MGGKSNTMPPGFRFFPTDEELVVHFLCRRASHLPCNPNVIPDLDITLLDPWDLRGKALAGDNQWYFFSCLRGNNSNNHATPNGYWMPVGVEEAISCGNMPVGMKKSLVFYIGEAPTGTKANWLMHEYHLLDRGASSSAGSSRRRSTRKTARNEWVLCRVYDQNCSGPASLCEEGTELSCLDEVFLSLDDLDEISFPN